MPWERGVSSGPVEAVWSPSKDNPDTSASTLRNVASSPHTMSRDRSSGSIQSQAPESSSAANRSNNLTPAQISTTRESRRASVMERTLIQVTEDNERFSVVDISGLNSSAAIKERMLSKLHIFDEDPNNFGLSRTEIGASNPDDHMINDDELLAMCWQQGDEKGTLKFLLHQVAPPAQPTRAMAPLPSAHSFSPRIALRDMNDIQSNTNTSTPTSFSRPPHSKSGSLSSHSSVSELISAGDSGTGTDGGHESNRATGGLHRSKATNRRSQAFSSTFLDETGNETKNTADAGSNKSHRADRWRTERSASQEETKSNTVEDGDTIRANEGHLPATLGHGHWESEVGTSSSRAQSSRSAYADEPRPNTKRTASHPSSNQTPSPVLQSPKAGSSALPKSLLPGGREPRPLDAAHMYLGHSQPDDSILNHKARNVHSSEDMHRRSQASSGSGEPPSPYVNRMSDPSRRQPTSSTGSSRPSSSDTYQKDGQYSHGIMSPGANLTSPVSPHMRNFDRERSASIGATVPMQYGPIRQGSDPRNNTRPLISSPPGSRPPLYPTGPSNNAAYGSTPPMRPGSSASFMDRRYMSQTPSSNTMHSQIMRPISPHPNEFGRMQDPRYAHSYVRPHALQDRNRFRPIAIPQTYHGPPLREDTYTSMHFPASSPRIVSEFQRHAVSQGSLQPGKTVQEVYHHPHAGPRQMRPPMAPPQQSTQMPYPRPSNHSPMLRPAASSHFPSHSASFSKRPDASLSPPVPPAVVQQPPAYSRSPSKPASRGGYEFIDGQSSNTKMPPSMQYFYNPTVPVAQNTRAAQPSGAKPITSNAHVKRPHTSAGEVQTGASERSSGSSFNTTASSSHRRILSVDDHEDREDTLSSTTSARSSRSMSVKEEEISELPYANDTDSIVDLLRESSLDDKDLVKMRPLPKVPIEKHTESEESTLKAGQRAQPLNDMDPDKESETLKPKHYQNKTPPESPPRPRSSMTHSSATSMTTVVPSSNSPSEDAAEDSGTFANFDDDDEEDFDQGGTWAQHLDSVSPLVQPRQSATGSAPDAKSEDALAPHQSVQQASGTSPRRPILTLSIDPSNTHTHHGSRGRSSRTEDSPSKAVSTPQGTSSSPASSAIGRRTSFAKRERGEWAFRPPPELLYDNLDDFFPKYDLDKPVLDAAGLLQSPQTASPRSDTYSSSAATPLTPTSTSNQETALVSKAKLGPKKSIRNVAQDRRRFLERAEAVERRRTNNAADLSRRRSTKLWGGRVVEVTPGVEQSQATSDSPTLTSSPEARPIFKWVKGDLIGKGTYGRVYLALNATTGEMIAVKQVELPTTASDREDARQKGVVAALKSEIETLKDLDHPNIVSYLGFEETTSNLSIFLEYVPGGSVGSCMRKHGKLDEATIKSFLHQILSGLNYLHGRGILHRDLKADNLLVDFNGTVKISDFGTVRKSEDIYGNVASMSMQGSIFWMAPEVVSLSRSGYSAKVDIWSLGCVVLEMFAGRRPWSDEEAVQAMFKIGAERRAPPIPPDVRLSKAAAHFLKTCFAVDPNERPTASRLLDHVFPHAEPDWKFSQSSLYRQLHR